MASGHGVIDARLLAMHRLVAEKLLRDPDLLGIARQNLERWRAVASPGELGYVEAWERLVAAGVEAAATAAVEESERGRALRQASPFAGVLTPQERWAFYGPEAK